MAASENHFYLDGVDDLKKISSKCSLLDALS